MVAVYQKTSSIDNFILKQLQNDIRDINKDTATENLFIKTISNKNIYSKDCQ